MPRRPLAIFLVAVVGITSISCAKSDGAPNYTLGPQDKIEVRVNDIRSGSGEAHSWPAFDGEFSVNPEGRLSLPLVGEIDAKGKTTSEIASAVANAVRTEVGLTQLPKVSVQITKYRPFYVLGVVDRPGEYEFRPGLDVLQAISIAGGTAKQTNVAASGFRRDALAQRGETKALQAEKSALTIKVARLEADLSGAPNLSLPNSNEMSGGDSNVDQMIRQERATLDAQRSTLRDQRKALTEEQESLRKELSTLNDKNLALTRQLELSRADLAQVSALIGRGLTVTTRQLSAEQNVTSNQSSLLDVQLATIRAKEGLSKSVRDLIELESKHRDDVSKELAEARVRLAIIAEKIKSSFELMALSERSLRLTPLDADDNAELSYLLTSRTNKGVRSRYVGASELMQPGDVLNVEFSGATRRVNIEKNQASGE